jgi:hypothetical protein
MEFSQPPLVTPEERRSLESRNSPYILQAVASLPTKACFSAAEKLINYTVLSMTIIIINI